MSSALNDLLVTDAELDRIAGREFEGSLDLVLCGLAAFVQAVDEEDMPPVQYAPVPASPSQTPQISHAHRGGFALAATVALVLSSSGVAAAMTGDALAPFHYVARHVLDLGPRGGGQTPGWDLSGSGQIGMLSSTGIGHAQASRQESSEHSLPRLTGESWLGGSATHHAPGSEKHPSSVSGRRTLSGRGGGGGHSPEYPVAPGRSDGGSASSPIKPTDPRHGHAGSTGMSSHAGTIDSTSSLVPRPRPIVRPAAGPGVDPTALPTVPVVASPVVIARPEASGREASTRSTVVS